MSATETRVTNSLQEQDLSKLDISKLTAETPEVISRQATINIGTIGHVAHGKSTTVKAVSGVQTVRFKNELERNITIKLERLSEDVINEYTKRKMVKRKRAREEKEFIVEKVVDMKVDEEGNVMFFIKWKNYKHTDNTWEPLDNLENCLNILYNFLKNQSIVKAEEIEKLKAELFSDVCISEAELEKHWKFNYLIAPAETLTMNLLAYLSCEKDAHRQNYKTSILEYYKISESHNARKKQLEKLSEWEKEINAVNGINNITVENLVDLAGPPENFTYLNKIKPVGVTVPDDPPIGCNCTVCSIKSNCPCGKLGGLFPYNCKGRLRVDVGTPIYECNKTCKCSADCGNRVVQKGRSIKLCIFRTSNGRGWGVKTLQRIPQGQFVCQYVGELITSEEATKRGKLYDAQNRTYLFDLDFDCNESLYSLDAAHFGNVSHFINHSCDPNLGVWAVWSDCLDPNIHMLALFANREVNVGEEICFDYLQKSESENENGEDKSKNKINGSPVKKSVMSPIKLNTMTECKCDSKKCRKFVFDCIS